MRSMIRFLSASERYCVTTNVSHPCLAACCTARCQQHAILPVMRSRLLQDTQRPGWRRGVDDMQGAHAKSA